MFFSDDPNQNVQDPQPDYDPDHYPKRYSEGFRAAARTLSILCVITIGFIYLSVPLGALAILFALLSGGAHKLKKPQKTAIRTAVIGMVLSAAVTGYMFYRVYSDPVLYAQMQEMVDYFMAVYNGESPTDIVNGIGPGQTPETQAPGPSLSDPDSILEYYLTPNPDASGNAGQSSGDGADVPGPGAASDPKAGNGLPDEGGLPQTPGSSGQDQAREPFVPDEIVSPSGGDYT